MVQKYDNYMKKIFFTLVFLFIILKGYSQTPIPEGGFENWVQQTSYEEPAGNWWTSLNQLKSLGGPVTVTKVSDSYSGNYAARLETKMWGTFILPGLLVSGKFVTAPPFVLQGKPFTDKPVKFKGYYKYLSVNNDSAAIYAMITKHNSVSGKRDTIAIAIQAVLSNTPTYTAFDLDFEYYSVETPDSIDVVFSSSAGGANFAGQIGSTLTVDDVMLEYGAGVFESLTPEIVFTIFPNPTSARINVTIDAPVVEPLEYFIYSLDGKLFQQGSIDKVTTEISTFGLKSGKYIFNIYRGTKLLGSKKFEVAC